MTANASQPRSRRPAASPATGTVRVPSTLWALGAKPLDPDDRWPDPVLAHVVGEFSDPGSRVLLIGWPAPTTRGTLRILEPDTAVALAAVRELDRHGIDAPYSGAPVDLVIASLLADHPDPMVAAEYVTAVATEVMAMGALLVVLSRCRHSQRGVLLDSAGSVVAAAQTADLLYLQHIIAAPVSGHTITTAPAEPAAPGVPRHTVAHTDVFVFLQPEHG
ncbi:hypothetical protein GV791_28770 [Nocardia cyriacigeorgica]|uniref:Class I SAM-dependent methyltransferase n=1 Tax=Nocardia cyriacigeorgica TaxID=135487 RepID=A0A6P1CVH5_9NOCA|nr:MULTISPECIES: hypothetical protein [Nocardia]NEW36521.1 hypothetical protein [Nocardia cyriacigeorgica]BDT85622.1 hypothetical protein FMUAM8_13860 [Nocardia cyriacigeorgica]